MFDFSKQETIESVDAGKLSPEEKKKFLARAAQDATDLIKDAIANEKPLILMVLDIDNGNIRSHAMGTTHASRVIFAKALLAQKDQNNE